MLLKWDPDCCPARERCTVSYLGCAPPQLDETSAAQSLKYHSAFARGESQVPAINLEQEEGVQEHLPSWFAVAEHARGVVVASAAW
jgi:hypothetical protein